MAAIKKIRVDRTSSTNNDVEDKGASATVEKARQLETSRTINGVGFNGTANITFGTDSVSEGSSNLYFTNARARGALSASTGISYNSSTGAISCTITQYTDAAARAAVSFTAGSGAYNSSTGVFTIPTNTSQLTNGANFITLGSISGSAPVSYNSGTGAISMAAATSTTNGYMTSTYAAKLDGIAAGATNVTNTNQLTNGAGYITGITSANVTTALGFTPYNSTNPSGYITASSNTSGTHTGAVSTSSACSTGALTVSGAITATGEITAYYSDDRLKKDVVAITDPINKLMQIRGVTFRPNETALALGITDKEEVGVIAQEIQAVLPQLVTGSAFEGYITVKYDKLTALLIEAVKAQQLQIDELKASIAKMRGI